MCFDHDHCDWYAAVQTDEIKAVPRERKCVECSRIIPAGMPVRSIYQQENETCECEFCVQHEEQDPDYEGPTECLDEIGETFSCSICPECCKLLAAIEVQEKEEGCPEWARQPMFGELSEVFTEHQQNFAYAEKAVGLYPELYHHPFILSLLDA